MRRLLCGCVCVVLLVVRPAAPQSAERQSLRWPQEPPAASHEEFVRSVFVINNFGAYAAGPTPDLVYFHDGIDISLANGTRIYAVADGVVRAVRTLAPNGIVVLSDIDDPSWGWFYTHVSDPRVRVGDTVRRGTELAVVDFSPGVPHLHLGRGFLTDNVNWSDPSAPNYVDPLPSFDFPDDEAPVIQTPFHYFLNESDKEFPSGDPTPVSGRVDIVAGMRDGGRFARGDIGPLRDYGDSHAPRRGEVSIASAERPDVPIWRHVGFDFSRFILRWQFRTQLFMPDLFFTIYKWKPLLDSTPVRNGRLFAYFILTNRGVGEEELRRIDPSDGAASWNTAETDARGRPLFPDGEYVVTVQATDDHGNESRARDRVFVRNGR